MRLVSKLQSLIFGLFGTRASKHAVSATSSNLDSLHDTQETAWIDGHGIRRSATDVFVSYHRGDSAKVRAVVGQLNAKGMTVFWDPVIPAGVDFVKFIRETFNHSRLVLVIWSQRSVTSEWVLGEAEYARTCKRLVSCRLEDSSQVHRSTHSRQSICLVGKATLGPKTGGK